MTKHKVLELFSGIGGMHYAWKDSESNGEIVAAIDINTVANQVYSFNFKDTNVMNKNIQALSADLIRTLDPDVLLMSPPCQPFTRNGLKKDSEDPRAFPFAHMLSILEDLKSLNYILMENVQGFESSKSRDMLIETLTKCDFFYREFLLTPQQFGIPNSRLRYYCLARKTPFPQNSTVTESVYNYLHKETNPPFSIGSVIENLSDNSYDIPEKFLKRAFVLDICFPDSDRSCCFTKAYTHFLEGTGSVYTKATKQEVKEVFEKCNKLDPSTVAFKESMQTLKLRFFTPKEVSQLMAFPDTFTFPSEVTNKQRYRLLGNSVNVRVVSELIRYLLLDI